MAKRSKAGSKTNFSDVLIASINKGQFLVVMAGALLALCIVKMPAADVSRLVFQVESDLVNAHLLGYALSVVVTLGWYFQSKAQRRTFHPEIERMGKEKSRLQQGHLGDTLESSENLPQ